MERTCVSLKENESVVFRVVSDIYNKRIMMDGTVIFVSENSKSVCVSWLEGYKERQDMIAFEDMVAVYDPDGETMKFENISGKSSLLIPR